MKANAVLQNLKLPTDTRVEWEVVPLRLEMLKFPPTITEALVAATDAHLMLFVGTLPQSLPFWLLDWLKRWAAARQVKDAVVAVTAGADGMAPALPVIETLREFAGQHGLSFIMGADVVHEPWIPQRVQQPRGFEAYRHWGINE